MALGDAKPNNFNNNNDKDRKQPQVFCPINLKNSEAECDPSELSFAYWKNMLKVAISPMIQNSNSPYPVYDHQNQGTIYLNHDKARMLYAEIKEFMKDPNAYNNMGVPSGASGLVSISNGKEFGVSSPILVIRKINGETGQVESSYMYQFKRNYRSIRNFDETNQNYDTFEYENLEIDAVLTILETFIQSVSYALAYSVISATQYDTSRINTKLDLLMDKAGIPKMNKAYNGGESKSFFNMNKEGNNNADIGITAKTEQTTIDELAQMIG